MDLHRQQGVGHGGQGRAQPGLAAQPRPGRAHRGALAHGAHLVHRAGGDQAAAVDDDDAVGEVGGLLQVVGGEEDGAARRRLGAHGGPEGGAGVGVQAGGRLVQDQQLGLGHQGHRQADALDLPAGAAGDPPPQDSAQVGLVDDGLDVGGAQLEGGDDVEGLADRVGGQDPPGLEDRAHAPGPHRLPGLDAQDGGGAGVGPGEAEEDVEGRGLAGPVGAEEGDDLAGGHREVEAVDGGDGAEGLGQAPDLDGGGPGGAGPDGEGGRCCGAHGSRIGPPAEARY